MSFPGREFPGPLVRPGQGVSPDRVFMRPDAQIAGEVRELLAEILFADPASITVVVHGATSPA
jgi:hypothetical protein